MVFWDEFFIVFGDILLFAVLIIALRLRLRLRHDVRLLSIIKPLLNYTHTIKKQRALEILSLRTGNFFLVNDFLWPLCKENEELSPGQEALLFKNKLNYF